MSLDPDTRAQIEQLINSEKVVVFMKGSRDAPECGFSAGLTRILELLLEDYGTVDVISQPDIREAIKLYSDWPTIPQLFVDGQFVGGFDIVREMHAAGDLRELLGLPPVTAVGVPNVTITDAAANLIREAMGNSTDRDLYVEIDTRIRHSLSFKDKDERMIRCVVNGIPLCFDVDSASRAEGLVIETDPTGKSVRIQNPNKPQTAPASPESSGA